MPAQSLNPQTVAYLRGKLLQWYAANRRDLPWRRTCDPYAIWVSEIMLQQTRVAAVVDRFQTFLARFPTVKSLARAPETDVLALWSGLGYYRRARMLHNAAQVVTAHHQGSLPATAAELLELPGIGPYTAAAIASIAYGEPVPVIDGNVERVLCRLMHWSAESGTVGHKLKVKRLAGRLLDPERPGDFNQAMMELGATVCLPRSPLCVQCPLHQVCLTRGEHRTRRRAPMQTREIAHALVLRAYGRGGERNRQSREVLLEQRPASQSVMPGLWQLPQLRHSVVSEGDLRMTVRHSIMQINYIVRIRAVPRSKAAALTVHSGKRRWVPLHRATTMPLTGLTRKILTRVLLRINDSGSLKR
ncbi:MAG TPA: A/G-specific adenine glycosylase [Terracidiphilus sp.]|nr:A/G-specific adenine glycosylase [Terracidiphilus sp.]